MLKKSVVFILITLIIINPVYSISLFPEEQNIYSNYKINKVLYDKQYTIQVYLESLTTKTIDGFQITINHENSQDTINIYDQLGPYSVKQYSFKISQLNPTSLEIRSISNNNHKLVFSSPITYTFNGNEQPIEEQPSLITTIQPEPPSIPQQLVNNPQYISYTSISKLDNEKNIIYFTKDHISSNRITTNQQGVIEYQANYQPYGNIYTQTGIEKFKFSGKELDSSNLYYFGARYYNSNIGRFTQVDPIYNPSINPYSYANNNPLKYVDPTGKEGKLAKFYKGVTQITEEVIAHNPEAPKIPITLHILSGSKDSPYISATTDYGTAIKFRGVQGDIVEFTAADVKGHILTTKDIVARIRQEVSQGLVTVRQGNKAIEYAERNREIIITPNRPNPIATVTSGRSGNARGITRSAAVTGTLVKGAAVAGSVIGTAISVNNIANAAEAGGLQGAIEQTAIEAGGFSGACLGAQCGAQIGLLGGPLSPVTVPVCAVIGGCVGGYLGSSLVQGLTQPNSHQQNQITEFETVFQTAEPESTLPR